MTPAALEGATVAIVGVGLVGGSLGLALGGSCQRRVGVVAAGDERAAREAMLLGAVDEVLGLVAAVTTADIVVLATPVRTTIELLPAVAAAVAPGTLVTDVGSTKAAIVDAMGRAGGDGGFVGGHPMAGGVTPGVANATASLFQGAAWVTCPVPGHEAMVGRAVELARAVGATALTMDAREHDQAAALVSHLPYVLARSLTRRLDERPEALPLAAAGWRRATQAAQGDEGMWRDILETNARPIADELDALRESLGDVSAWLRQRS